MVDIKDIYWVAGLLEADGCFSNKSPKYRVPMIQLMMTDMDTVIRVAGILGTHKVVRNKGLTKAGKYIYRTSLYGGRAVAWCMTLLPLMSERRSIRIAGLLKNWKLAPRSGYSLRKPYSRGAHIVWMNVTKPVNFAG